jgi:SseB protein N-terminal domain
MTKSLQTDFISENSLELSLINAQTNLIPLNQFLQEFIQGNVFILSASSVETDGSGINPLIFDREGVMMVAVFTSLKRTKIFAKPGIYCLEIQGGNFLERIPKGCGLVLNPGLSIGLEIPPLGLENIQRDFLKSRF